MEKGVFVIALLNNIKSMSRQCIYLVGFSTHQMKELKVNSQYTSHNYALYIGKQLNGFIKDKLSEIQTGDKIAIITDDNVNKLYVDKFIENAIPKTFCETVIAVISPGEASKSRETKAYIEDNLLIKQFRRNDLLIAFGGGVINDVTGFTASTYKRGIHWVSVPTTLLSMSDASIGGKTAINTDYGKNTIGTFYNPDVVFCDLDYLNTLTEREIRNGIVELVKHFLLCDTKGFDDFCDIIFSPVYSSLKRLTKNKDFEELLYKSISIKKRIIEKDPTEKDYRKVLNLGHTIGHAIEKLNANITHGEAVAMGIILEMKLGKKLGITKAKLIDKIEDLFRKLGIDTELPSSSDSKELMRLMSNDKKNTNNTSIDFILLKDVGKIYKPSSGTWSSQVDNDLLNRILDDVLSNKPGQIH